MKLVTATLAVALRPGLRLRNEKELVEEEDGSITEKWVPVDAQVGEVIDVSEWAELGSYIDRGMIRLLTPDESRQYEAEQAKAKAAAKSDKEKPHG